MNSSDFARVKQVLDDFAQALVDRYKSKLTNSNASGDLTNTMKWKVTQGNDLFEVSLDLQHYWYWIETGRAPGKKPPPINVIERWILIKPIIPQARAIPGRKSIPKPPSTKQLAFLISRSIGIKGITPKPFLKESIDELMIDLYNDLGAALLADLTISVEYDLTAIPQEIGIGKWQRV